MYQLKIDMIKDEQLMSYLASFNLSSNTSNNLMLVANVIVLGLFRKYGIYWVEFAKNWQFLKLRSTCLLTKGHVLFVLVLYRNQKLRSWLLTWRTQRSLKSQSSSKLSLMRRKKEMRKLTKDWNPPMKNHDTFILLLVKNIFLLLLCSTEVPALVDSSFDFWSTWLSWK